MRARFSWLDWKAFTVAGAALLVLAVLVNWRSSAADPEPKADAPVADDAAPAEADAEKPAEEEQPVPEKLEDLLEVEFDLPLKPRRGRENEYSVDVRVKNVSEEPVEGPVYLAITGTNVDGLVVVDAEGTGRGGDPLFEVIADGRSLSPRSRRGRQLKLFFRIEESDDAEDSESDNEPAARTSRTSRSRSRRIDESEDETAIDYELTREGMELDKPEDTPVAKGRTRGTKNRRLPIPHDDADLAEAMSKTKKNVRDLMKIPGVVGVGTTIDKTGSFVCQVLIRRLGVKRRLPQDLDGLPIVTKVSWGPRYLYAPDNETIQPPPNNRGQAAQPRNSFPQGECLELPDCDENPDLQSRYDPLIPIGAEIRNQNSAGVGTNGGLVTDGSQFFYISNAHVLARATDNTAQVGELINQPGTTAATDVIGTLARFGVRDFTGVTPTTADVAVALVDETNREGTFITPCAGYGGINAETARAEIGMTVQKAGRTTGYTSATVLSVDYTIDIGGVLFENQISVRDETGGQFGQPGDSGSLVVVEGPCPGGGDCRFATGLLFAGESSEPNPIVWLNHIDNALNVVGNLQMVGQPPGCPIDPTPAD